MKNDNDKNPFIYSTSNQEIEVKMVGMEKIQKKFQILDKQKSISLPFKCISKIKCENLNKIIPNVSFIDLSYNLINNWNEVFYLIEQISKLNELNISFNVFTISLSKEFQMKSIK
jgi:hypothetical protein